MGHVGPLKSCWWRQRHRRINRYAGARVPPDGIVVVGADAISDPRKFYKRFVRRRRPCIIRGTLPELPSHEGWWAPPAARALKVQVEIRDGEFDSFGKGRKVEMTFGELLDGCSTNHYLTTQEVADGAVVTAPLNALGEQLPLRPALLGALVPQTINMWLGHSTTPASSGLHHDFHDNLYVLLRGAKHFRLFSPADAHKMYTHGRITRVHPNGRINYPGNATAADGRVAEDVAAAQELSARLQQKRAQRRLLAAEVAAESGEAAALAALEEAEASLDEAMDEAMRASEACERAVKAAKRREEGQAASAARAGGGGCSEAQQAEPPPSFSRIENLATEIARAPSTSYPLLAAASLAECDLEAGDMLYLPAGWFHEVSSQGAHCAINYWCHPPDDMAGSFERPYSAQAFWEREWRRGALLREREAATKRKKVKPKETKKWTTLPCARR
jgi:hypothetical protein